jgi:hypothetical protein
MGLLPLWPDQAELGGEGDELARYPLYLDPRTLPTWLTEPASACMPPPDDK